MPNDLALSITFGASVGAAMSAFGNLKGRMGTLADATKDLRAKQKALGLEIKNAAKLPSADLHLLNEQYAKMGVRIDALRAKTRQLGQIQSKIAESANYRANTRGEILGMLPLAYAAAKPVSIAVDFEESFAEVKKVVDDTPEGLARLREEALDLTRRIPVAFQEMNQIIASGAQGGIARAELTKYGETVSMMKVAFDLTAEAAGDAVAKIKNIYGIDMDKIGSLGDVINYLSNTEATGGAGNIIDTMQRAGSVMRSFGLSDKQSAGFSASFNALGQAPDVAATSIKNMLNALSMAENQTPKFQNALAKIGLSARDMKKAIAKDAQGAITMVLERLAKIPQADRAGVLFGLFGKRGVADIGLLVNGIDKYKEIMSKAGDAAAYAGSMQKEFAARSDTTKNALQLVGSEVNILAIELSATVLPMLRELVDWLRPILKSFAEWAKNNQGLVKTLFNLGAGLIAARLGFLVVGYALSTLFAPLRYGWLLFVKYRTAMLLIKTSGWAAQFPNAAAAVSGLGKALAWVKGIAGSFGVWLGQAGLRLVGLAKQGALWLGKFFSLLLGKGLAALSAIGKAILWLGRVLLMNPIGLVITAIAVAAFLIYKYWGPIKAFFAGLWRGISFVAVSAWQGITDACTAAWQGITGIASSIWQAIKDAFAGGILGVAALIINWHPLGLFYRAFAGVMNWFGFGLPAKFTDFGRMVLEGLWSGISSKLAWIGEKLSSFGAMIGDKVKSTLGIASPSRVFASIGMDTMLGLEQGLARRATAPLAAMKRYASAMTAAGALTAGPAFAAFIPAGGLPHISAVSAMAANPALSAMPRIPAAMPEGRPLRALQPSPRAGGQPGAATPASGATHNNYQFTINAAPGMDERKLADLVARKIKDIQFAEQARARSRLIDAD